jgi:hypothetical protein
MDISKIERTVLTELTHSTGLYSLKLQNHIYGCFIVMEDIVQQTNTDISGTILHCGNFTFDFDKQFSEIGLRYGFAMDTNLILDKFEPLYKEVWIDCFRNLSLCKDLELVDKIEDAVNDIIQKNVSQDEAFFLAAVNTGSLPHYWIDKVISLIQSSRQKQSEDKDDNDNNDTVNMIISKAEIEKPINIISHRRLQHTRRNNVKTTTHPNRKRLSKTRRHV